MLYFCFFKQSTAYEMRISDWSSDVCSSDLAARERASTGRRLLKENPLTGIRLPKEKNPERPVMSHDVYLKLLEVAPRVHPMLPLALIEIGRASCRERVGQ